MIRHSLWIVGFCKDLSRKLTNAIWTKGYIVLLILCFMIGFYVFPVLFPISISTVSGRILFFSVSQPVSLSPEQKMLFYLYEPKGPLL